MPVSDDPTALISQLLASSGGGSGLPVPAGMADLVTKLLAQSRSPGMVATSALGAIGKTSTPTAMPATPQINWLTAPKPPEPPAIEEMFKTPTMADAVAKAEEEKRRKAIEALERAKAAGTAKPGAPAPTTPPGAAVPPANKAMTPMEGPDTGAVNPNTSATPFEAAMRATFIHEGGYNAKDANGFPVNMGINQEFHPTVDVKNLTKAQATEIYKKQYWDAIGGDSLPPAIQGLAFDTAVISGVDRAKQMIAQSGGDPAKLLELRRKFEEGLVSGNPEKYGKYAKTWAARRDSYGRAIPSDPDTRRRGGYIRRADGGSVRDLLALSRMYGAGR